MITTPRCRVVPLPDDQVSFVIDGVERTRWHFSDRYPGPFFYPFLGPGGETLTRMGHPGAPNHDHHRSIWFAHNTVAGVDFWAMNKPARMKQRQWLAYQSGNDEAVMAVRIDWFDGHDPKELLTQDLVASVRPGEKGETFLELQSTFLPNSESLEFQMSNFGVLGVRVAESISAVFGGGTLTGADGRTTERNLFGKPNAWMDYRGPVPVRGGRPTAEGVTLFDHPENPNHPVKWHVRDDGWIGPSLCRESAVTTTRSSPLVLRYLLHAHAGPASADDRASEIFREFSGRPAFTIERSKRPNRTYEIRRT